MLCSQPLGHVYLEADVHCSVVESNCLVVFLYLGILGLSLVCSRHQLGEPNRHNWSQQLERQREPCRGHGTDERLSRQACRQRCRGGVEPWHWTELSGGPGHLSSMWTQEDYPLWWGEDVWWVKIHDCLCVLNPCVAFCSCMKSEREWKWKVKISPYLSLKENQQSVCLLLSTVLVRTKSTVKMASCNFYRWLCFFAPRKYRHLTKNVSL